ncbi:hypothetical protein K435DRAFT_796862 [Dendrothele bispora CBS 962.96]|uniref:Uncharacterized protein n=1 Tax=Dendrothele bispora (strain CBS 962.96) TaxID=1314807 RepID=A0A4S8M4N8_DENBC|nr:hypothetical protein K435DRAFT_796862 [Dendrothele bispora CBS 962.96]
MNPNLVIGLVRELRTNSLVSYTTGLSFRLGPAERAVLLNPEVGDRFFVGSTLLTRVGPNSKKGKRKGKGEKDEERPKAQPRPECPIHTDSISAIGNTKKEKDDTVPGFTGNALIRPPFYKLRSQKTITAKHVNPLPSELASPSILTPRTSSTLSTIIKAFTLIKESPELGGKRPGEGQYKKLLGVGPGENVEDEPNQVHKELGKKLDRCMECGNPREPEDKGFINIIVVQLRGGCKSLMSLRGGGNTRNLELREGKLSWYTSWKWQ